MRKRYQKKFEDLLSKHKNNSRLKDLGNYFFTSEITFEDFVAGEMLNFLKNCSDDFQRLTDEQISTKIQYAKKFDDSLNIKKLEAKFKSQYPKKPMTTPLTAAQLPNTDTKPQTWWNFSCLGR